MKKNVIDYLNALEARKDLSMGAKAMMFDLIMIWNRWYKKGKGWDGWFHATDHGEPDNRYVIGENISNKTYTRYRNELIEKGCIDYERRFRLKNGGKTSRYKLLLEVNNEPEDAGAELSDK